MTQILSGRYKGRKLFGPEIAILRPTQSLIKKSLFDRLRFQLPGSTFLDLFAGIGSIGLEALSLEASHVTFVEQHKTIAQSLQKNIERFDAQCSTTLMILPVSKALDLLLKQKQSFDFIFADPPYAKGKESIVAPLFEKLSLICHTNSLLIIEESKEVVFPSLGSFELQNEKSFGKSKLLFYKKP